MKNITASKLVKALRQEGIFKETILVENTVTRWPWGKYRGRLIVGAPTGYLLFCIRESVKPKTLFKGPLLDAIKAALAVRYS